MILSFWAPSFVVMDFTFPGRNDCQFCDLHCPLFTALLVVRLFRNAAESTSIASAGHVFRKNRWSSAGDAQSSQILYSRWLKQTCLATWAPVDLIHVSRDLGSVRNEIFAGVSGDAMGMIGWDGGFRSDSPVTGILQFLT